MTTRLTPAIGPLAALLVASLTLAGCGHHAQITSAPPPPRIAPNPAPPGGISEEDQEFIATHRPIYREEGFATWYDAPYTGRKAANGQPFDRNAFTAAHRTLPMGSLLVVTNQKTHQSSIIRVTDRGPFVKGRTIDLSIASAKATGVYRAGLAPVQIDVYKTPHPMFSGGRWCVQIGVFEHSGRAIALRNQLQRKYPDSQVLEFTGDTGYWVRIRPAGDNREAAERIADRLKPAEGDAFLTRLD